MNNPETKPLIEEIEKELNPDLQVDINEPGIMVHGIGTDRLSAILTSGIKLPREVPSRMGMPRVPDYVSLSAVISRYYASSVGQLWGSGETAAGLVIDPKYIASNKDTLLLVGGAFRQNDKRYMPDTLQIDALKNIRVAEGNVGEVFFDEIWSAAIPPEAIIGIVFDDMKVFERFKDVLPTNKPLVVYDNAGNILLTQLFT